MNILAGRARSHGRVSITSDVRLNNYAVDPTNLDVRKGIAFVAQDDSLQVTSTPREAIRFSAKLRLPRDTPEAQIEVLVERMLSELGLTSCADTIVGGALIKGISGGERKVGRCLSSSASHDHHYHIISHIYIMWTSKCSARVWEWN